VTYLDHQDNEHEMFKGASVGITSILQAFMRDEIRVGVLRAMSFQNVDFSKLNGNMLTNWDAIAPFFLAAVELRTCMGAEHLLLSHLESCDKPIISFIKKREYHGWFKREIGVDFPVLYLPKAWLRVLNDQLNITSANGDVKLNMNKSLQLKKNNPQYHSQPRND
jgi:hypothetical protein